eukprot:12388777-Alexandrium_andersonii.AAC.1
MPARTPALTTASAQKCCLATALTACSLSASLLVQTGHPWTATSFGWCCRWSGCPSPSVSSRHGTPSSRAELPVARGGIPPLYRWPPAGLMSSASAWNWTR